jgi:hypothetical protein
MGEADVEQHLHVRVLQPVVRHPAAPAHGHDPMGAQ